MCGFVFMCKLNKSLSKLVNLVDDLGDKSLETSLGKFGVLVFVSKVEISVELILVKQVLLAQNSQNFLHSFLGLKLGDEALLLLVDSVPEVVDGLQDLLVIDFLPLSEDEGSVLHLLVAEILERKVWMLDQGQLNFHIDAGESRNVLVLGGGSTVHNGGSSENEGTKNGVSSGSSLVSRSDGGCEIVVAHIF